MPGIVGLVTKLSREVAEPQLQRMIETLRHKPSYRTGTWIDESLGLYVGWAAREGSFCDDMPISNEQGDVVLIFSGEEFPAPDASRDLHHKGHVFDGPGCAYLVHSYEDDPAFPSGLNGRFHGIVADRTRGIAVLFTDRYGMHRLYCHESQHSFYFAAEAKALMAVRPELRSIDPRSLGEYISCGCVLENRTIFPDIQLVPPASSWVCREGRIERRQQYFQTSEWENQGRLDPQSYYLKLRDTFSQNLPRYLNGPERVALSLTGGLDTRMILAWSNSAPGTLPCYTFGGRYRASQDVTIGARVANFCRQPHKVISVGSDFLARFPHYAEQTVYLTDGCADVSRSPVLYTNEQVAEIAPVRITGNYGSEILRRMVAFKPSAPNSGLFHQDLAPHFREAQQTYDGLLQQHPASFIAFSQLPWHHWGLLALEQTQVSPRSPYVDNDLVRLAFRAPDPSIIRSSIFADNDDCLRLIADGNESLSRIRTDRGLRRPNGITASLLRAWLEFTFRAEYEYDYGMRQWLAKVDHLLSAFHFERLFLGRHKYYHFRVWYRDALSRYVREMLLDSRTLSRPYVQRKRLDAIVQAHTAGKGNYTLAIHKVLTLELLHRLFID